MKEINGIIYMYTNKLNGKVYIGQTIRENKRKLEHMKATKDNTYFHKAVLKYGYDNFSYQVLYKVKGWNKDLICEVLNFMETYYINLYNSTDNEYGYNLTTGGDSNYSVNDYVKQKMREGWNNELVKEHASKIHKGCRNGMYGIAPPNRKKIMCVEENIVFESIKQAAQWLNVKEENMYNFLCKLRNPKTYNKTYHGYNWVEL